MSRETFRYDGKRYDIRAKNDKELGAKVATKKKELEEGRTIVNKNTTLKQWSFQWLDTYKKSSISFRTYKDYLARLNKHILPEIGNMKLKDIKPVHCQKVLNNMTGYSKDRVLKINNTMYQMFKKACSNHLILFNPADDLAPPKAVNGEGRALTDYERSIVYKVSLKHKASLWARTMIACGFRPGEMARFMGCHIDYKKKGIYIDGTKTEAAKRWVPAPNDLLEELKALNKGPYEYIFTNEKGGRLSDTNITKLWHNFWREMNIAAGTRVYRNELIEPYVIPKDCTAYCCRHTFATDCKDAGIPWGIIKEILGHANKDVTDGYTHRTDRSFKIAQEMLSEYRAKNVLGGKAGGNEG